MLVAADLAPFALHELHLDSMHVAELAPGPALATLRALTIAPPSQHAMARMFPAGAYPALQTLELAWHPVMFPLGLEDLEPIWTRAAAPQLATLVLHRLPPPLRAQIRAALGARPPPFTVEIA